MKRFQFRLEGLLRLRKVEEDRCLQVLRAHQCAMADIAERRELLGSERSKTVDALRRLETGDLEMEQVLRHRRYLIALDNREREIDAELIRRRNEMQGAQKQAEHAVRERQLVEKLRTRHHDEYRDRMRRVEAREFDEIAGVIRSRARAVELDRMDQELR